MRYDTATIARRCGPLQEKIAPGLCRPSGSHAVSRGVYGEEDCSRSINPTASQLFLACILAELLFQLLVHVRATVAELADLIGLLDKAPELISGIA